MSFWLNKSMKIDCEGFYGKKDYPTRRTDLQRASWDNFSPAAYIVDTIDSPLSSPQSIYLNGDFAPDLFPTIAHEGYPGHMYQNVYYKSLQPPAIRCLIDYGGYTEGWATYVEHYTPQYAPNQSLSNELYVLNDHLSLLITALLDIGVHYDGWTLEQFREQCSYFYGELEEEEAKEMYRPH